MNLNDIENNDFNMENHEISHRNIMEEDDENEEQETEFEEDGDEVMVDDLNRNISAAPSPAFSKSNYIDLTTIKQESDCDDQGIRDSDDSEASTDDEDGESSSKSSSYSNPNDSPYSESQEIVIMSEPASKHNNKNKKRAIKIEVLLIFFVSILFF